MVRWDRRYDIDYANIVVVVLTCCPDDHCMVATGDGVDTNPIGS